MLMAASCPRHILQYSGPSSDQPEPVFRSLRDECSHGSHVNIGTHLPCRHGTVFMPAGRILNATLMIITSIITNSISSITLLFLRHSYFLGKTNMPKLIKAVHWRCFIFCAISSLVRASFFLLECFTNSIVNMGPDSLSLRSNLSFATQWALAILSSSPLVPCLMLLCFWGSS